jgi:hypothetical protein
MSMVLTIWGIIAGLYGLISLAAFHEIEAGIGLLIATLAIGCASVIAAMKRSSNSPVRYRPPTE